MASNRGLLEYLAQAQKSDVTTINIIDLRTSDNCVIFALSLLKLLSAEPTYLQHRLSLVEV